MVPARQELEPDPLREVDPTRYFPGQDTPVDLENLHALPYRLQWLIPNLPESFRDFLYRQEVRLLVR